MSEGVVQGFWMREAASGAAESYSTSETVKAALSKVPEVTLGFWIINVGHRSFPSFVPCGVTVSRGSGGPAVNPRCFVSDTRRRVGLDHRFRGILTVRRVGKRAKPNSQPSGLLGFMPTFQSRPDARTAA